MVPNSFGCCEGGELRGDRNGSCAAQRLRQAGEHHEVGVKLDTGTAWTMPPPGRGATVRGLDAETLLRLLEVYETALRELGAMNDPAVSGLMRRLERHRAEVIAALAELWFPET